MKVRQLRTSIPGWYDASYLEANGITPEAGAYIRSKVPVTSKKISGQLQAEEERLKKAYEATANLRLFVIPKLEQAKGSEIELSGATDQENVEQYLAASLPEGTRFTMQAAEAYMVNLLLKIAPGRSGSQIRFLYTRAENVLSFKKVKIPYGRRGFVLLKGVNGDWPGNSIGSGKTSALSLLTIALTGKTPKGQVNDQWAREKTKDRAEIKLVLRDSRGRKVEIVRQRRSHHLTLIVDGKDQSQGISGKGKNQTQGLIEELTGFDYRMLMNSVYIDQTVANSFVFGEQKDRLDLVNKLCSLERFEIAKTQVGYDMTGVVRQETEAIQTLTQLEAEIGEVSDQLAELENRVESHWAEKLKPANAEVVRLCEIIDGMAKARHFYDGYRLEVDDLESDYRGFEATFNEASADVALFTKQIATLDKLLEAGKCTYCGQSTSKLGGPNRKKLEQDLSAAEERRVRYQKSRATAADKIEKLNRKIGNYEKEFQEALNDRELARREWKTIEEAVEGEKERNEKLREKRRLLKSRLQSKKRLSSSISKQLQLLDIEKEMLDFVGKAFHRTGMPMYLSAGLCPVLNRAAAEYSELFTGGKVQIVFGVEDGEFTVSIVNPAGSGSRKGQSKGESAWAGCIAAFALRETAPKTNLLILDEPGHGLDQAAQKQLAKGLLRLKDRFETIIVTTHSPVIESILSGETTWTVTKTNGISNLEM